MREEKQKQVNPTECLLKREMKHWKCTEIEILDFVVFHVRAVV
jgi:hypothetical protein